MEEIEFRVIKEDDKFAAVLMCLGTDGHGRTVKEIKECASRYVPVSEKKVRKIVQSLISEGILRYDTRSGRIVATRKTPKPASMEEAYKYITMYGV